MTKRKFETKNIETFKKLMMKKYHDVEELEDL